MGLCLCSPSTGHGARQMLTQHCSKHTATEEPAGAPACIPLLPCRRHCLTHSGMLYGLKALSPVVGQVFLSSSHTFYRLHPEEGSPVIEN